MSEVRIEDYSSLFGKVSLNFIGVAANLYEKFRECGEIKRQKNINHLGLLSHSFSTLNHSRYDYLLIQSVISELVENSFKGTTTAQGSLTVGGKKYSGNEILKTWFMLSNFGHCKNTIGDEKTLMILATKRRGFKSYLLKPITDSQLKVWAEKIIDRFDYIKFHHILALHRVYKLFPRNLEKQNIYINLYKILLLPSKSIANVTDKLKLIQLKILYKNIRTLSIISLDTQNSHIPLKLDILSTILSFDFNVDKFQGRKLSQLYDPLINLLYDKLYLSTQAQTLQRSYEIRSLNKIKDIRMSYKAIMETSFSDGLADPNINHLKHFVRKKYTLAKGQRLKDHFNIMQQIKSDGSIYESSIDFNSLNRHAVIDIFYEKETFTTETLGPLLNKTIHLVQIIDRKQLIDEVVTHKPIAVLVVEGLVKEGIIDDQKDRITRPMFSYITKEANDQLHKLNKRFYKNLVWSIIRLFIKDKYYFDLDNYNETTSFGAIYSDGNDHLTELVESEKAKFIGKDNDRVKELDHVLKAVSRKFEGLVIACIDRIKVYDYSKSPNNRGVTDIDSFILKFNEREIIVEFNETKSLSKNLD